MKMSGTVFSIGSLDITWLALVIAAAVLLALYIWIGLLRERKPRIRLGRAFARALRAGGKHPGNLVRFLIVETCLTMLGLVPLLFLLEPGLRLLALLAVPLWLLIVNPARINAAAGMQACLAGESIFSFRLVDLSRWKELVIFGIKRMLFLMLWLLPLAGTLLYIRNYWLEIGQVDAITWIGMMKDAGNDDFLTGVINTAMPMVVMLAVSLALVVIGIAFHSSARHACALEQPGLACGHRGKLVFGWFLSLVFMLPLGIALVMLLNRLRSMAAGKNDITELWNQVKGLKSSILMILGGGTLLTLPLLPFRSLTVADMVRQLHEAGLAEKP